MTTGDMGLEGYAPKIAVGPGNPEAQKYGKLWATSAYRLTAPGEALASLFLAQARPQPGAQVLDIGCGTGRGGLILALVGGLKVTLIDFVSNCLDPDIRAMLDTQAERLRFVKADVEHPLPVTAEYGFCTDVMEHIPPDNVTTVLRNILTAAQHVFFSIASVDDQYGALIGERLHLTVERYGWWLEQFARLGCVIHWSRDEGTSCQFYVSAWATGKDFLATGRLNTTEQQVRDNVQANIAGPWAQATPHELNDLEVMILGGGPSLPAFEDEIRAKRDAGVKLVTLNGTYTWALERGLIPSATVIVDARPFNARFVQPVVDGCKYLIASQCDPSVFAGLPVDRTIIWHTSAELIVDLLRAAYPAWWGIPGGTTVLLRAIPLLRFLGYTRFHLYGCDSCLMPVEGVMQHHAYAQPENDGAGMVDIMVSGGRVFRCHPWQINQAEEFMQLVRVLGDEVQMAVYGDGLLAHIVALAAERDEASLVPVMAPAG